MADTSRSTSDNDKFFFRNESISSTAENVPRDLLWAIKDDLFENRNESVLKESSVGSIEYQEEGDTSWIGSPMDLDMEEPKLPTPVITEVISQKVYQDSSGATKTNVVLGIQGIDGVQYKVRISAA